MKRGDIWVGLMLGVLVVGGLLGCDRQPIDATSDRGQGSGHSTEPVTEASADPPAVEPEPTRSAARVLMVSQSAGYQHSSVTRQPDELSPAEQVFTELGISSGKFRVDCTQDVATDFTKDRLEQYDIMLFFTSGKLPIPDDTLDYFLNDWLKQPGHGFIGTHSATDTYKDHPPFYEMIGGTFNGHPWSAGDTVAISVHDPEHPAAKPWGDAFEITDEIYRYKNFVPENVRVLMSLDMSRTQKKAPYHVPISWCRDWGEGKVFYISLGHREDVWTNPTYGESLLGAIDWILGHASGDATPNPEVSAAEQAKAQAADEAAESSE